MAHNKTVSQALLALEDRECEALSKIQGEREVLALLPPDMASPGVLDWGPKGAYNGARFSLSFHKADFRDANYQTDTAAMVEALRTLEAHGFTPAPMCLAGYGNYRKSIRHRAAETIPDVDQSGNTLRDTLDVSPAYVKANNHTGTSFHTAYLAPNATRDILEVKVDVPLPFYPLASREEYRGGWRFTGPAIARHPGEWSSVLDHPACACNAYLGGDGFNPQGLDALIAWGPSCGGSGNAAPSAFLEALLPKREG